MKNLPVKRHHFFWMFLFWFAVADMIFLLGKIETTYAEVGAALTPVEKSLCMNTEYLGVHGDAPGLDCYRVDSGVYMAPQCDVGGRCYYNGCFPTAIGTQCLYSYPLTEKSGIDAANSESPNSVGQFYLYTVPKPTTNTPFPEGIATLGYDFELRKGTVRYTEDINNLPESKTCTKSLGLHETNNCQPYLGSAVFTQHPCGGMPAGWGCFYVDESNLTGDPLFTYHRYIGVALAHPPVTTPPSGLSVTCSSNNTATAKSTTTGAYTNMIWRATVTGATGNVTYSWIPGPSASGGKVIGNSYYAYANPNQDVAATVTVFNAGRTASATCAPVRPPANTIGLSCTSKSVSEVNTSGLNINQEWTASTKFGKDPSFIWSGIVQGSTNPIKGYISPGSSGTAVVTATAQFPGGASARETVTCDTVTAPPITIQCNKKDPPSTGVPGSPSFVNAGYEAKLFSGTTEVPVPAVFSWSASNPSGSVSNPLTETGSSIYLNIKPGSSARASVSASLDGKPIPKATCPEINIPEVQTSFSIDYKTTGTPNTPGYTNVELKASALSGGFDYTGEYTFRWSIVREYRSTPEVLSDTSSSIKLYVEPDTVAKVSVVAIRNNSQVGNVYKKNVNVVSTKATCSARRLTEAEKRMYPDMNAVFTGYAKIGSSNIKTALFDWTLTDDGNPISGDFGTKDQFYYKVPAGKTVTATVVADNNGVKTTNDDNTCTYTLPPDISFTCEGKAPFEDPDWILWNLKYSFVQNGVTYTQDNLKPTSVKWQSAPLDPFLGFDPPIPGFNGSVTSVSENPNPVQDPLRILNYYGFIGKPSDTLRVTNKVEATFILPSSTENPPLVKKNNFLASILTSIYNHLFAYVQKPVVVKKEVACQATDVIKSGESYGQKIAKLAKLSQKTQYLSSCSPAGCAILVNNILKALGIGVVNSDNYIEVFNKWDAAVRKSGALTKVYEGGGRPKTDPKKDIKKYKYEMSAIAANDLKAVQATKAGDIIYSNYTSTFSPDQRPGHVAIIVEDGAKSIIDSGHAGQTRRYGDGKQWVSDFGDTGMNLYIYRAK